MRGELDDALNRMARMEELQRRRAAEAAPDDRSPVDEVIDAVRRVVAQHPTLRVALWAEDGAGGAGVRAEWSDGEVVVQLDDEPDGQPPVAAPPTAALPSVPDTTRPAEGRQAVGYLPQPPGAGPADGASPGGRTPPAGGPPESWPVPVAAATTWPGTPENDTNESAARLAELIRQDPSLLRAPDDPYPPE